MTESGIGYTDLETGNENETIPINLDDYEIKNQEKIIILCIVRQQKMVDKVYG